MKEDLTQGPVIKTMLRFAVSMIFGNLLQQCYNIADTRIVGGFLGLVPLICGLVKKRIGLAIGGFFACLGGGLLLGLILAVPMCVLFMVLIFVTKSKTAGMPYGQYPGQAPYQGPIRQNDQPPVPPSFPAEQEKMPWEETQKK